jgi:hypothetical protein
VYKKLQKEKYLEGARFFFLKDENDRTELLGFQAEGVIEKPINFFKVHERIHKEEDREEEVIELTDVVEESTEQAERSEPLAMVFEPDALAEQRRTEPEEGTASEPKDETTIEPAQTLSEEPVVKTQRSRMEEPTMEQIPTVDIISEVIPEKTAFEEAASLEAEVKTALGSVMQDTATKLVEAMTPAVSKYIEDYTRRVLFDIAEKVIREEIDKLLKESMSFPGKQI